MTQPPYKLSDINQCWKAVHQATLVFVTRANEVLLIRKKRGLGAGKINGPGGKLDEGETVEACAVREIQEELGITTTALASRGELRFQFSDGYSIHVFVFVTSQFSGTPIETEEAVPLWIQRDAIPYDEMWEDDRIWLPRVLDGESVDGSFIFDSDTMLDHKVEFNPPPSIPTNSL